MEINASFLPLTLDGSFADVPHGGDLGKGEAAKEFQVDNFCERRLEEADRLEQQTLETQRRLRGEENLTTIHYMMNAAEIKAAMGAFDEGEKMSVELIDLERRLIGPDSPETAETTYSLATIKAKQGKKDEALLLLHHAVDHGMLPREALTLGDDPDLKALHNDSRFDALVAYAKRGAAAKGPH